MKATGGYFNLFQVLGIGHYEVKTHSPILVELLSPVGRHGQGNLYLRLFLEQFGINSDEFDAKSAVVVSEYYIGTKTEEVGGRIDIVIKDGIGRKIFIENKIYAGDQENQLIRYRSFDRKARLFYLTLLGSPPSNLKPEEVDSHRCECISYKDHIRKWLTDCRKEASCIPSVREVLSQYIALLEELTNQSTTALMNEDLIREFTNSAENLDSFFVILNAETAVKNAIVFRLDAHLDKIAKKFNLLRDGPWEDLGRKASGFGFKTHKLERNNIYIRFEFDAGEYSNFFFGFAAINPDQPCPVAEKLQILFSEKFQSKGKANSFWPAWAYYEDPYRFWGQQAFEDIRCERFSDNLNMKVEVLIKIAEEVCGGLVVIV